MQDWLDKFMVGKKKYSASVVLPIIIAVINVIVANPETAQNLTGLVQEFVPTLIAFFGGIAYTIIEGLRDRELAKGKTTLGSTEALSAVVPPSAVSAVSQLQPSAQAAPAAPPAVPVVEAPPEPLDIKAFHERVLADVESRYKETNPATIFYEACDKGSKTKCEHISHAQDYYDYLVSLAYAAEAYVKEQTQQETAAAGGCKGLVDPEYAKMLQDLNTTIRNRDYVYALARTNIDWKTALDINATLYNVGVWAQHLITTSYDIK